MRRGQENSTDWNADILYSKAKKYFPELKDLDFVLKYRKNEDHLCILTSATFSDFAILNQQSAILRLEIDIELQQSKQSQLAEEEKRIFPWCKDQNPYTYKEFVEFCGDLADGYWHESTPVETKSWKNTSED